jgi:HEAT repeat protein
MALSDAAALGGIASRLAKHGDDTAARRIVHELDSDLRSAKEPEDKRGLIVALRNAGAADDDAVRALASDKSAAVRSEVARTLGDDASPDAHAALLSLTSDSELVVASTALQSLGRDAPSADDVHAIAAAVLGNQTPPALDGVVMDFFAGHLDSPEARAVLAFILARTKDPALARRVRALLEQMAT